MQLHYKFRLYPTRPQQAMLARAFGCARVVFNDALRIRDEAYQAGLPYVTDGELSAKLTASKKTPERAWLADVSAGMLQQALGDLCDGYRNFFASVSGKRRGQRMRPPRYRSRKDNRQSIRFGRNTKFRVTDSGHLRVPKIGFVEIRLSRPLPAEPSSVTIIKDASGRYFASFVVEAGVAPLPESASEVGVDLGLKSFAVLSDGRKIDSPQFLRRAEKKLKRAQRDLCRKKAGSKNREKARARLAKLNAHIADSRRDFHHKLSTALVRDNQAVYVEDLNVEALGRARNAKSVHDAGWGRFVDMLAYKAVRADRILIKVGRWEPTTQTCSTCGARTGPKALDVRLWTCGCCGATHDRDVNAAVNVLKLGQVAAGYAETENACGGDVSPPFAAAGPCEAGTRQSAA